MSVDVHAVLATVTRQIEQHPVEIAAFGAWLADRFETSDPRIFRHVLEIGVRHGGTSEFWYKLLPSAGIVVGVDRIGHDSYQLPEFRDRAVAMERELPNYRFVEGNSTWQSTLDRLRRYAPFTFVFIDGDHSYDGVRADFQNLRPMVIRGGIVAFHDIVDGPRTGGGVARLWRELNGDKHEFVVGGSDWGGIGAVVLP
jgi:cephalosporin hydroxylase